MFSPPSSSSSNRNLKGNRYGGLFSMINKPSCISTPDQKSNLTKQEKEGLKKLQERINKDEIIVMKTNHIF